MTIEHRVDAAPASFNLDTDLDPTHLSLPHAPSFLPISIDFVFSISSLPFLRVFQ